MTSQLEIYKICQVCLSPARVGKRNQNHFGAVSCSSCCDFFKRCHRERSLLHTFKCKFEENCDFLTKSRNDCKRCRYLRCRKFGMDPLKVLQGDQRKKFTFMKKAQKVQNKEPVKEMKTERTDDFLIPEIKNNFNLVFALYPPKHHDIDRIIQGHFNPSYWNESNTQSVMAVLKKLEEVAYQFCKNSKYFQSLKKEDQIQLMVLNSKLFSNYILSQYLTAKNGYEQVSWLLGDHTPLISKFYNETLYVLCIS